MCDNDQVGGGTAVDAHKPGSNNTLFKTAFSPFLKDWATPADYIQS